MLSYQKKLLISLENWHNIHIKLVDRNIDFKTLMKWMDQIRTKKVIDKRLKSWLNHLSKITNNNDYKQYIRSLL